LQASLVEARRLNGEARPACQRGFWLSVRDLATAVVAWLLPGAANGDKDIGLHDEDD
jgi:hypothetical protein